MHDDQERLTEALSAYLDDALEGAERDALERHLATCAACRAELAGLRRVGALLRALPEPTLPRSFTLPETTPARTERPGAPRAEPPWARAVQWVGGMAAALGAGLLIAGIVPPTHFGASDGASMAPADHTYSQGGAASAPATKVATPTADFSQSTGQTATPPPILTGGATPEPTETGSVPAETATPSVTTGDGGRSAGSPLAPAGATLLVGGGAALAAGTVSRRRQRRSTRR